MNVLGGISILLLAVVVAEGYAIEKTQNYEGSSCEHKPDGVYPLSDVFSYVECKSGKSTLRKCTGSSIFEPGHKACVSISTQNPDTFCQNRTTGDWQNPWDCHSLFKCVNGISYKTPCQLSNLVFDPYLDQCVYPYQYACHEVSVNTNNAGNPCESKGDGKYGIPDVFSYLQCTKHVAKYISCTGTDVFDEKQGKCVSSSSLSKKTFCDYRTTRNYRDPWDCHSFITCDHGTFTERPCPEKYLVFDPYHDLCEYPEKFKCKQISQMQIEEADNLCESKGDGKYGIPDVFGYLECTKHVAKYVSCTGTDVFDEKQGKCVSSSSLSKKTFCDDRATRNYRDPWDCHSFITCVHGTFFERPCAEKNLVYDPYHDKCEDEEKFKCKELEFTANQCATKADGNYPIPDVFTYLVCKNHTASYDTCAKHQIYDPETKKCIDIKEVTYSNFCTHRDNGDWVNPFNCNGYILCHDKIAKALPCLINGFIFNPYLDVCVRPGEYPCEIAGSLDSNIEFNMVVNIMADDPCKDLTDGEYAVADMFSYLQCKNHVGKILECQENYIYDSQNKKCSDGKSLSLKTFCEKRDDSIYQNLWDCHSFISCVHGSVYVMQCAKSASGKLVYDPYFKRCERESSFRCRQLDSKECSGLPDGLYPTKDLFKYLQCTSNKGTYQKCPPNHIFSKDKNECVNGNSLSKETFCIAKADGNYQDPWDCHSYISCVNNRMIERPCAIRSLVYDPFVDQCEFETKYECNQLNRDTTELSSNLEKNVEIGDICTTLPDGYYATRNVLQILECKGGKSNNINCPDGEIYVPGNKDKCTDAKKINQDNFCVNRTDGNWQNPFNCHYYYTCHAGQIFNQQCSYVVLLNYDPVNDSCEYPYIYPCKNVTTKSHYHVNTEKKEILTPLEEDPCAHLPDGIYAVSDVGVYMHCHQHRHSYEKCGQGQIYTPGHQHCVPIESVKQDEFCKDRSDGNWRNPWNCHDYITCHAGRMFDRPCSIKTTLNFNPYLNLCEYPYDYKCENITKKSETHITKKEVLAPLAEDPCAHLPDGIYAIPDVGVYMYCHYNHHHYVKCPPGDIFMADTMKCSPLKDLKLGDFCRGRRTGNWRNPWNCHHFISCNAGITIDRTCSFKATLNYNPYLDKCEYPYDYKCENISTAVAVKSDNADRCLGLQDGNYAIRDVAAFLVCKDQVSTLKKCPEGQIYVPGHSKCTQIKEITKDNFCKNRPNGDWRNPWDCHSFIICSMGHTVYLPCAPPPLLLTYDPYADVCSKSYECKDIGSARNYVEHGSFEVVV